AKLFQGHSHPPVWENTATSVPRGGAIGEGRVMTRVFQLLTPAVLLAAVSLAAVPLATPSAALAQGSLNVYCSVQAEWCQAVANEFQRQTGTRVALTLKGSGETLAQVKIGRASCRERVEAGGGAGGAAGK